MNDRLTDMLFIALLLLITSVLISWTFVVEPRWNFTAGDSRPGSSFLDGARENLENFLSPALPGDGNMSTELTGRLRGKVTMLVDGRDVAGRAEEAAEESALHEDRSRTLGLMRGAMGAFNRSLATAEWRIARAREDKSKSPGEIREAEEALDEMQRGAGFISDRIERAEETGKR